MRNLKAELNDNGGKEFNRLLIENIDDFFRAYQNHYSDELTPYEILRKLEEKIMFENDLPLSLQIPLKMGGLAWFDRAGFEMKNDIRTVTYTYSQFSSLFNV